MIESKETSFLMTRRDVEILTFINDFGFVGLTHLMKRFCLNESNCYKRMQRLIKQQFVIHERVFHNEKGVYRLSAKGAEWTELQPIVSVQRTAYVHQLMVIEVYIALQKKYPDAYWVPERRLIKDEYFDEKFKNKHIADGLLILPDDKQIAIEVELSLKEKSRLYKIFKNYAAKYAIDEVWYYCTPKIINPLKKLAEKRPYIKIFDLKELLA